MRLKFTVNEHKVCVICGGEINDKNEVLVYINRNGERITLSKCRECYNRKRRTYGNGYKPVKKKIKEEAIVEELHWDYDPERMEKHNLLMLVKILNDEDNSIRRYTWNYDMEKSYKT